MEKVKYTDRFDKELLWEDAVSLPYYNELIYDEFSNNIKITNQFENGKITFIKYYKNEQESEEELVRNIQKKCDRFAIIFRESFGSYIIENESEFAEDTLLFKTRYLINRENHYICWEDIDLESGLPDYKQTKKYLFKESNLFEILECSYNEDGSLDHIIYKPLGDENSGQDWEYYDLNNFAKLQLYFNENLDYYLNAKLNPAIE